MEESKSSRVRQTTEGGIKMQMLGTENIAGAMSIELSIELDVEDLLYVQSS